MAQKITPNMKVKQVVPFGYEMAGEFKVHFNPQNLHQGFIMIPIRKAGGVNGKENEEK